MDLQWARRIKEIGHRWVASYRRKKSGDNSVHIVPIGRGPIELTTEESAIQQVAKIESTTKEASEKFHHLLHEKQEKSKVRLMQRRRNSSIKRNKSSILNKKEDKSGQPQKFVRLCVPEHVEIFSLGFKLKWKFNKCIAYDVQIGKIGDRAGLKNGFILVMAGGTPMKEESLVTKELLHDMRPLELVFEGKKR